MSLADDAKILLIPSGYKTDTPNGKLYSVFPTDGSQDFRIDRATTGTRINPGGLIETMLADTPRLNHYGGGCPSVLREVGRTNLQAYSENFSGAAWTTSGATITANSSISPNGELTAYKLETTSSLDLLTGFQTVAADTLHTYSLFVKADTTNICKIELYNTNTSSQATLYGRIEFDMSTETIVPDQNFDASFDKLNGGWYRLKLQGTTITPKQDPDFCRVSLTQAGSIFIWGAQMEAGIGATSYIKTTTAIVTRNLDNINCENQTYETGNDVTWFLDFNSYTFTNSFRPLIVIRNAGFTETMDWITYNSGSDYYFRIRVTNQSSLQTIIDLGQNAIQMFERNKVAVRLYGSNFEIYVNGVREYTGTSTNGDWKIINNLSILNDFGSHAEAPSMNLYDFRVYDKTMTQSDLETLTTL